ncbi:MAG TPA: hypothetical protein VK273_07940 [Gaiellaceae bacterium]|nr:hypothetical protein [Gaiellaceae bacterium]
MDPEKGRVTLAGRDLREYRQEDIRRAIAVAGQDSHLFSTAHLDPATASQLIDDVLEANGSRTTLLITHRSEGLERMDEVVTLESGVLA